MSSTLDTHHGDMLMASKLKLYTSKD